MCNQQEEKLLTTTKRYGNKVKQSLIQKSVCEGIKGSTNVSNWLVLPTCSIIDYMHASILGTTKHILNLLSIQISIQPKTFIWDLT